MNFKVGPENTIQLRGLASQEADIGKLIVKSKHKFYVNRVCYGTSILQNYEPRKKYVKNLTAKINNVSPLVPWMIELYNPLAEEITVKMSVLP